MNRYCVVGAGAAGLAALKQMIDEGFDVDCFEKSDQVGGHWNTDYDFLHLITSRNVSGYDDWPMPEDWPLFPARELMLEYFNRYAKEFNLFNKITFNTEVRSVEPVLCDGPKGSAGWIVNTDDGAAHQYEGVLIANGHLWDPKIPDVQGTFSGKQIHSANYQNTQDVEGRVLVVGAGNSGCDLAVDCAQHLIDTSIVIRSGHYFQPKTFFGKPRAELAFMNEFSFEEQDLITRLMMRLSVGTAENYPEMPKVEHRTLAEGPPVVNNLLLYWIHHGRIKIKPGIERFDGKTVHFTNGTAEDFDTILWATGFKASLPMIDESLLQRKDDIPLRTGAGVVPLGLEKCYLIGMIAARGGQPMQYPIQTDLAIRMIKLHERSEGGNANISGILEEQQEPDCRIDILRPIWFDQVHSTKEILTKLS